MALKIAFECEDKTHLPRAAEHFFLNNDGYVELNKKYKLMHRFGYGDLIGGVYRKL